jgi:UDP-N-acetylglucosamine:LPS N-acetylglucosamine transferase
MRRQIEEGVLRLSLVAGRRSEVVAALREALYQNSLEAQVDILEDPDVFGYIRRLNALLADADALWSKPSEMTFFAALGLPFISAPPVGVHEAWNLRWATDRGAGLPQHDPQAAGDWLQEWLEDGVLASAAWAGYQRLPQLGLYEIAEELGQH